MSLQRDLRAGPTSENVGDEPNAVDRHERVAGGDENAHAEPHRRVSAEGGAGLVHCILCALCVLCGEFSMSSRAMYFLRASSGSGNTSASRGPIVPGLEFVRSCCRYLSRTVFASGLLSMKCTQAHASRYSAGVMCCTWLSCS